MEINELLTKSGIEILNIVLTIIMVLIGTKLNSLYKKVSKNEMAKAVIKTVVTAVEQIYKDIDGEKKYELALSWISDELKEKNINISTKEVKALIEEAVYTLKNEIHKQEGDGE